MNRLLMSIVFMLLYTTIIAREITNIKIIEKSIVYNKESQKLIKI